MLLHYSKQLTVNFHLPQNSSNSNKPFCKPSSVSDMIAIPCIIEKKNSFKNPKWMPSKSLNIIYYSSISLRYIELFPCMPACLPVCLSVFLPVCLPACLSVCCPWLFKLDCLSITLFTFLPALPTFHQYVY